MKFSSPLFPGMVIVVLSSCVSLEKMSVRNYAPIVQQNCDPDPRGISLFFDGEDINFEYQKLGVVTLQGYKTDKILNNIKYIAWKNCGNAVILLKSDFESNADNLSYEKYMGIVVWSDNLPQQDDDTSFISVLEE